MRPCIITFLLAVTGLISCVTSIRTDEESNTYQYSWESIKEHPVPNWFDDAKLGIFIHWGPQSLWPLPWNDYQAPDVNYPLIEEKFCDSPPDFGFKDVVPMFKAEKWDPEEWADLFYKSGAGYVILTGEHHVGYMLSDSRYTEWCATRKGPMRDLVGDLGKAVRDKGLKYAPSYHRERHAGMFSKTKYIEKSPPFDDIAEEIRRMPEALHLYGPFEYNEDFYDSFVERWKEWEEKYKPDFMWIDDIPFFYRDPESPQVEIFRNRCMEMIADYLNLAEEWGKEVYFNNKGRAEPNWPAGAGCFEYDLANYDTIVEIKWQCPLTMAHSWYYNKEEEDKDLYKSPEELIYLLCDVVSKNGNLLLNIGPRADGTIPNGMKERLLTIGKWLEQNGEAIYGTRPWQKFKQDEPGLRFTSKPDALYAICFEKLTNQFDIVAHDNILADRVEEVTILGNLDSIKWEPIKNGIRIIPPEAYNGDCAWVYKISLNSEN